MNNVLSSSFPQKSLQILIETKILLGYLALCGYNLKKFHNSVNLASTPVKLEQFYHFFHGITMRIK